MLMKRTLDRASLTLHDKFDDFGGVAGGAGCDALVHAGVLRPHAAHAHCTVTQQLDLVFLLFTLPATERGSCEVRNSPSHHRSISACGTDWSELL